jgi:hypothetical protein
MPRAEFDIETSLSPEQVRAAFLDFSERRPEIWPSLEPSLYEVYSVDETSADVKEGSKLPGMTVWARERYEFADPMTISWQATESNFCTPGSGVTITMHPREGGGTRMHVVWQRVGTTVRGKLAIGLIALMKGKPIAKSVEGSLRRYAERAQSNGTA